MRLVGERRHVLDHVGRQRFGDQRIDHQDLGSARFAEQLLHRRYGGEAARPLPQFWLMKSSNSSGVVLGSTVTGLSAGAGGAFTLAHSSTMSPAHADTATPAKATA